MNIVLTNFDASEEIMIENMASLLELQKKVKTPKNIMVHFNEMYYDGANTVFIDDFKSTIRKKALEVIERPLTINNKKILRYLTIHRRVLMERTDTSVVKNIEFPLLARTAKFADVEDSVLTKVIEKDVNELIKKYFVIAPKVTIENLSKLVMRVPAYNLVCSFDIHVEKEHYSKSWAFAMVVHAAYQMHEYLQNEPLALNTDTKRKICSALYDIAKFGK